MNVINKKSATTSHKNKKCGNCKNFSFGDKEIGCMCDVWSWWWLWCEDVWEDCEDWEIRDDFTEHKHKANKV